MNSQLLKFDRRFEYKVVEMFAGGSYTIRQPYHCERVNSWNQHECDDHCRDGEWGHIDDLGGDGWELIGFGPWVDGKALAYFKLETLKVYETDTSRSFV